MRLDMDLHEQLFGSLPGPDDLAQWAASGAMALTGAPDGPPLAPPASLVPAVSDISTLITTTTTRLGRAVAVDGLALLGERAAVAGLHRQGRRSCGGATELLRCADGWLALALARSGDAELLPAWIGGVDVADRIRARPAGELVERAIDLGLACACLGELRADEPAFQLIAGPDGPPRPELQGLLVVDLSALWAGPLCASVLTSAGARVVKVESLQRLDGARFGPPAFYDLLHAGQESVALDFHDAGDVATLHRLLERADVVIEASRPACARAARRRRRCVGRRRHGRVAVDHRLRPSRRRRAPGRFRRRRRRRRRVDRR